jgi:hypothetical protein
VRTARLQPAGLTLSTYPIWGQVSTVFRGRLLGRLLGSEPPHASLLGTVRGQCLGRPQVFACACKVDVVTSRLGAPSPQVTADKFGR